MQHWELILFFFTIAMIYASVGFGGGSSYLAIMALYAFPFQEMRLIALVCNIIVVTGGSWIFIRSGHVNWKKIIPIVVVSVPAAYIGAKWPIKQDTFFVILGGSLIIAGLLLWIKTKQGDESAKSDQRKYGLATDGVLGGAIGFLSGLVGIGGGIFLSPILNLLKWDTAKKIAATASFFILVNSVSGLAGQLSNPPPVVDIRRIAALAAAVFVGGQIGTRLSAARFNVLVVKRITALLVLYAGVEVLYKHLHNFFV